MSDDTLHQQLARDRRRLGRAEVVERPPLYLPIAQRVLNPFPLASSGGVWGDIGQPWPVSLLALYATVYVDTTNSGASYWTVALKDLAGTVLAAFTTASIAANTTTRFAVTSFTQPAASNMQLYLQLTATGSPGAISLYPSVALLRTGA